MFLETRKALPRNKSISLYKTDEKKGKGVALSHAKEFITTTHVVIHDADLEYFPEDIIEMFEESKNHPNSMILGSRFIGEKERKNVYTRTTLANKIMSLFFSVINFYYISDVATCYKLIPVDFYKKTILKENGFSIEIEMLSKFLKYNRSIKEVPIKYEGRSYDEGKKIKTSDIFHCFVETNQPLIKNCIEAVWLLVRAVCIKVQRKHTV